LVSGPSIARQKVVRETFRIRFDEILPQSRADRYADEKSVKKLAGGYVKTVIGRRIGGDRPPCPTTAACSVSALQ
jgi:hypothetical protein